MMSEAERVRVEEAESAASVLYPIRFITPAWSVAEERERIKQSGKAGLDPTFEEVEEADLGGKKTWRDTVNTFLNPSEIGHGKDQYDPNVRPIDLVLGGLITVRLRSYKGSHAPKGIVRVFADSRLLGYDPIEARMERGAREWRIEALRRERSAHSLGALGVDEARAAVYDDRQFPRNELEARRAANDAFFAGN